MKIQINGDPDKGNMGSVTLDGEPEELLRILDDARTLILKAVEDK